MSTAPLRELWRLTRHLSYFQHHGRLYAYHDQMGDVLAMSPDIVELLEFHRDQERSPTEVDGRFGRHFGRTQLGEFLSTLEAHRFLVDPDRDEDQDLWRMVPVQARHVVYHQPAPDQLTFWHPPRRRAPSREQVPAWAARLWPLCQGERTLEEIFARLTEEGHLEGLEDARAQVSARVLSWVHHSRQLLRMSKVPLRRYRGRVPPYLLSEMPFSPWSPGDPVPADPLESLAEPVAPPHDYYREQIQDADHQFEDVETTLSHLLRRPHPLLGGQTYAQRVAQALLERGMIRPGATQIVEIGAGRGDLAVGLLRALLEHDPEGFARLQYAIVDLSGELRQQQERALAQAGLRERVTWFQANIEQGPPQGLPQADLLVSNEVIGDLTTLRLTRGLVEEDQAQGLSPAGRTCWEQARALCQRLEVSLVDAPPSFFLNLGALQLMEHLPAMLKPGGAAWITEYGDQARYPRAASHLDHMEFSIHFGHLAAAAGALGLEASVEDVQDLIGWNRYGKTLASTRSWFAALRAMLADHGLALPKLAWTDKMLAEHLGQALPIAEIGNLRFEPSDQRCMGLQPHEFKALLLRRP